jgi:hypothetical protein
VPTELERLNVRGIQADANEAKRWYERAAAVGRERQEAATGAAERGLNFRLWEEAGSEAVENELKDRPEGSHAHQHPTDVDTFARTFMKYRAISPHGGAAILTPAVHPQHYAAGVLYWSGRHENATPQRTVFSRSDRSGPRLPFALCRASHRAGGTHGCQCTDCCACSSFMLDITRFTKVLALAGSNMDGEALAALRKAKALLSAANLSFTDVAQLLAAGTDSKFEADYLRAHITELEQELKELRGAPPGTGSLKRARAEIAATMRAIFGDTWLSHLSDREIARRTGVSPQTVGNWRRRLEATQMSAAKSATDSHSAVGRLRARDDYRTEAISS